MEGLKAQLAPLGHSPEDKLKRRAIEHEIALSEQQHNEQLKTLEEKASVALSHVEQQHRQALAKLQAEFPKKLEAAPPPPGKRGKNRINPTDSNRVNPTDGGGGSAGSGRYDYNKEELAVQQEAVRHAEAHPNPTPYPLPPTPYPLTPNP